MGSPLDPHNRNFLNSKLEYFSIIFKLKSADGLKLEFLLFDR